MGRRRHLVGKALRVGNANAQAENSQGGKD